MDRTSQRLYRVLHIDDQPVCGYGLTRLFRRNGRQSFSMERFVSGLEDLEHNGSPDIIAMEISVAKSKGIAAIKDLCQRFPQASILILTGHDEVLFAERCLKAGAKGYLMKTATASELIEAFAAVADGNIYISDRMRNLILKRLSGEGITEDERDFDRLSDRELLIVQHIGQSKNNKEIASELHISTKTIESHRSRIKSKLRLASPNELVRYAMRIHNATI